jgi:hypothetical protein
MSIRGVSGLSATQPRAILHGPQRTPLTRPEQWSPSNHALFLEVRIATRRAPSALRLEHSPLLLFSNSISSYKRTTIERNVDEPLESSGLGDICVAACGVCGTAFFAAKKARRRRISTGLAHPLLFQRVIVPEMLVLGAKQVIPLP